MPIYDYDCNNCKESFSLLQSINPKPEELKCPHCNSKDITKKISSFSCCLVGSSSGYDTSGLHASHTTG